MRLALVFNPFKYKIHEENLRIVQKYFGLFPPLSLAWVASIAESAGHSVKIIDARTLNLSKKETLDILKEFKPDILGFMMTTYMFRDTLEWIKYLKQYLNIPVMIGGYNLRVYPKESLSHPEIDFGIVEHAYYTLPLLFKEIENKTYNFNSVPGLVFKSHGAIHITPHPQKIDFDKFPNPARHLLPNELYAEFPTERKNFTVMVTSLGCPFECTFCEAGQTPYNPRSPETVVAEIEECYQKFNIREIDIFDYEFTGMRRRVLSICKLLQEKKMDITWACRARIDNVDEELLREMKKAGLNRIYFGIESGNQHVLDLIKKRITLTQIRRIIAVCHKLKIKCLGFFLLGTPQDTKENIKNTVNFAKELDLDYVQFSKCLAKPLTPLWKSQLDNGEKDYWKEWVLGNETDRELPRTWCHLSNQDINKLTRWAYLSYYMRFKIILKHLKRVHSFSEFKRKSAAFLDMLFNQEIYPKIDKKFKAFNENTKNYLNKIKKKLYSNNNNEI